MIVEVLQSHIDHAEPLDRANANKTCPVALALQEQAGDINASCGYRFCHPLSEGMSVDLPAQATAWIENWVNGKLMRPITFEIEE